MLRAAGALIMQGVQLNLGNRSSWAVDAANVRLLN